MSISDFYLNKCQDHDNKCCIYMFLLPSIALSIIIHSSASTKQYSGHFLHFCRQHISLKYCRASRDYKNSHCDLLDEELQAIYFTPPTSQRGNQFLQSPAVRRLVSCAVQNYMTVVHKILEKSKYCLTSF